LPFPERARRYFASEEGWQALGRVRPSTIFLGPDRLLGLLRAHFAHLFIDGEPSHADLWQMTEEIATGSFWGLWPLGVSTHAGGELPALLDPNMLSVQECAQVARAEIEKRTVARTSNATVADVTADNLLDAWFEELWRDRTHQHLSEKGDIRPNYKTFKVRASADGVSVTLALAIARFYSAQHANKRGTVGPRNRSL
jgi:hypothetical protein